jgi:hypothetical protein
VKAIAHASLTIYVIWWSALEALKGNLNLKVKPQLLQLRNLGGHFLLIFQDLILYIRLLFISISNQYLFRGAVVPPQLTLELVVKVDDIQGMVEVKETDTSVLVFVLLIATLA